MPHAHHFGIFKVADRLVGVPLENLAEVCVVARVSPTMDAGPGVLGAINLRGVLVPLMDLARLAGMPCNGEAPKRAVILQNDGQIAAMALDDIVALTQATPCALARSGGGPADLGWVAKHGFLHDSEMVSCLDIPALFAMPSVVTAAAARPDDRTGGTGKTSKLLIVSCGGASFAIDAVRVHATVPRLEIDRSEVSTPVCLGFVAYQGWKVPVVDAARVLGLGRVERRTVAPIVILRIAPDQLLGLAVSSMERIVLMPSSGLLESSAVVRRSGLLPQAFVSDDRVQTHIVDLDALAAVPDLVELASLSMRRDADSSRTPDADGTGDVRSDKQRYLLFRAGRQLATPTSQIVRILNAPESLVPVGAQPHPSIYGLFEVDGHSVPLVGVTDQPLAASDIRFVLLVGAPGAQIGFAVEQIEGVLTSVRRAEGVAQAEEEDLVELRVQQKSRFVAVAELATRARTLAGDPAGDATATLPDQVVGSEGREVA